MDLPEVVERSRFVRAMVQVLLLELANRNSGERTAEIPIWLIEGLSQQLLFSSEVQIILPPPTTPVNGVMLTRAYTNAPRADPLETAHRLLTASTPLTFDQLSWPTEDQLSGEAAQVYACSAQLFVHNLLRLEDGRASMGTMLTRLPEFYNWQLAFLRAFHSHFQRPLDIEKWWALQLVHFTGRELAQTWSPAESWQKLDETLRWPVDARAATNEPSQQVETSLQTIIRQWDRPRQAQALKDKVRELEMLRLRVAPEFVGVVEDYRRVLEAYLQELPKARFTLVGGKKTGPGPAAEQAIKQLDALDLRRQALRPAPAAV
jgi:hypothetical protein